MSTAQREFRRVHRPPRTAEARACAHACAVTGCVVLCSPGHVACRRHWCQIPQVDRDPLIIAFQRRATDPVAFALAMSLARRLAIHYAELLD